MATRFQVKRSSVSGVRPTTTDIQPGELAVNIQDGILFSANSTVVFEAGANLTSIAVGNSTVRFTVNTSHVSISNSTALVANGSNGTSGHVLHSNGTGVYWAADDQGVTSVATGSGLTGGTITATGTISVLANNGITANTTGLYVTQGTGAVVNATGVHVNSAYIGTLAANSATYANGSISNTFTVGTSTYFVANGNVGIGNSSPAHKLRVEGDISLSGGIHANGSLGTSGQVLTSNGTVAYWAAAAAGVNTAAQYAWTNTHTFSANVNFDSNTLFIDSVNNAVGIGTSAPASKLQVEGDVSAYFYINPNIINSNYTIPTNYNAMTAGPITVANGVTVTVSSNSTWTVV